MPIALAVVRSELAIEAGYDRPHFDLFENLAPLIDRLFTRLLQHGLKLSDVKVERGAGNMADLHLLCYLFDYVLTLRVRVDRVEGFCSALTIENQKRIVAATTDALLAIREHLGSEYRTYNVTMNLHGTLEKHSTAEFLGKLIAVTPKGIGPLAGNGVGYYFGPSEDRIFAAITLDVSALMSGGLYVRPSATWDANRVALEALPDRAELFMRTALAAAGLELPQQQ